MGHLVVDMHRSEESRHMIHNYEQTTSDSRRRKAILDTVSIVLVDEGLGLPLTKRCHYN